MSHDSDLLRVVLALQMGFVTKEQVVECGALWAEDRKKSLTEILIDGEKREDVSFTDYSRTQAAHKVLCRKISLRKEPRQPA